MSGLSTLYRDNLSLLTDLYQITMAYGYWKSGMHEREAVFHLYFRTPPFIGRYTLTAGLETAIEYMEQFHFSAEDIQYLATLQGNDGKPLFEQAFLDYLHTYKLTCTADAIPEGTIVFPNEPLMRIRGPLIDCQLLETPLLNIINFQSLIATKASRVVHAAQGDPVIEFGLRRAQGPDGSLSASRAAYIGGCTGTSNVLAGKLFGIPVKGTHAHAWVMAFPEEKEAFMAYAKALPNNCIFLVDTYDTLTGVKHAIEAMKYLKTIGHKPGGIRLDSGDLAALSIAARKLLDEADFPDTSIVASNDLDEYAVATLKEKGAKVNVWGIGTKLVTASDQPALGGVYKLGAIRNVAGEWEYRVKISGDPIKVTTPGILQVKRFTQNGNWIADVIYDEELDISEVPEAVKQADSSTDLLVRVLDSGKRVYHSPVVADIRAHCLNQLEKFNSFLATDSQAWPVLIEKKTESRKMDLIKKVTVI